MSRLILLNKPFGVLCQFSDSDGRPTLAEFVDAPGFYPAGRLDRDSEGLVLLTDDGSLQQRIANPRFKLWKSYLLQVEGCVDAYAVEALATGVELKDGLTRPARVSVAEEPRLWPRQPPIRERATKPTSWLRIQIREGRNRQLRRMCAAVGFPVLRLVRTAVGDWSVEGLAPGQYREQSVHLPTAPKKTRTKATRKAPRRPRKSGA